MGGWHFGAEEAVIGIEVKEGVDGFFHNWLSLFLGFIFMSFILISLFNARFYSYLISFHLFILVIINKKSNLIILKSKYFILFYFMSWQVEKLWDPSVLNNLEQSRNYAILQYFSTMKCKNTCEQFTSLSVLSMVFLNFELIRA